MWKCTLDNLLYFPVKEDDTIMLLDFKDTGKGNVNKEEDKQREVCRRI